MHSPVSAPDPARSVPSGSQALAASARPRRWSLAARLSVVFLAVLALVVVTFGVAAYRVVRESAVSRASERIASVSRELATTSGRSGAATLAALGELARDSGVLRAVAPDDALPDAAGTVSEGRLGEALARSDTAAMPPAQRAALATLLQSRRRPGDSTVLGRELWTADGTRRYGAPLESRDSALLAATAGTVLRTDSAARSVLYTIGERAQYWLVVPVRSNGRIVGVLAERRRVVGSAQTEATIESLTGQDVDVYFTSRGSSEWVSVRGRPVRAPFAETSLDGAPDSVAVRVGDAVGGAVYAAASAVAGSPWRIVLVQSEASTLSRPHAFLRQIVAIGLLLIFGGTLCAWWLSRREVRPLAALRRAAESMAQGDYGRVVAPSGAEETAALAEAFNTMSTRISSAHATLEEQNDALQRANAAKARFLAVMSHELRTPLNAIGGFAELMALGVQGPVTPEQRAGLDRIKRNQGQLLHLVSDILHYARLEATPLSVRHDRVPVQEQLVAMRESMAEQFARKSVSLQTSDTEAVLVADPVRVQQVLLNLVTNALQFTEPGGSVAVHAEPSGAFTAIHVRDNGSGIALDQQEAIFEPFVQADNSLTRRVGGTGLGLAIVRQLVTAMGGDVRVKSVPGKGSTFTVMLPTAVGESSSTPVDVTITTTPAGLGAPMTASQAAVQG